MKIKMTIPIMVSTAVLLSACGGGGSSASPPIVNKSSFNLSGSVPGTLIETYCEDGSYHSIKSTQNGTAKHPFSLTLPANVSCRLVMTTNEDDPLNKVITPIKFINAQGISSIAFSAEDDVDLDYVDLALSRKNMLSDANEDGVEDIPKEILLSGTSVSALKIIVSDNDPLDDDKDGIINVFEDDDGDRIPNHDDDDDDGDGIIDSEDDDNDNDGEPDNDKDGDGIKDKDDKDDENDGKEDDPDGDGSGGDSGGGTGAPAGPVITTPSAGRLLASQCAQCHGTDGDSVTDIDSLVGESRGEIVGEMLEMQAENKNKLMHLQAKGYNAEQIGLIGDYFSSLSGGGSGGEHDDDEGDDDDD